jgi:hypothetical protein
MNAYKVYSGRKGCMCGCLGKYSYTAKGAVEQSPGYEPNINERSVKIITGKLLRNSNTKREDDMLILEQNGRVMVAWVD